MAERQEKHNKEMKFRRVELLKKETLGVGSYGSVCKANCDGLICAAKIIHPTLVLPTEHLQISPQRFHRLPSARFEAECDFLRDIRHPNIIQYIGTYQDPETGLPVLLMELMDESLTHYLDRSTEPIPYYIQVVISMDVSMALSFLHLNGIVHRDLSSNNILLIGKGVRAKLSDFGMAKLVDVNFSRVSNTLCPGTDAYMPPEAIDNQAVYTEKGDVFSFGVNIIQILTKKFPKPGLRFQTLKIDHPHVPTGSVKVNVSEVERRSNHISEIQSSHPLLPVALDCLKDQTDERPSAGELCQTLAALKVSPHFKESEKAINTQGAMILQLESSLFERDQLIEAKDMQLKTKGHVLDRLQVENEKTRDLISSLREELQLSQDAQRKRDLVIEEERKDHVGMIAQFQRRITELEQTMRQEADVPYSASSDTGRAIPFLQPSDAHRLIQRQPSITNLEGDMHLNRTKGKDAPCTMLRVTDAVVDGNIAYFRPGGTRKVYSFDSIEECWLRHPACPTEYASIAIVNGLLTTIGGSNEPVLELLFKVYNCSKKLFCLVGQGWDRKWAEILPPMTTKRRHTTSVSTEKALIVAGGLDENSQEIRTVEIMNTDTKQWSIAADLPEPMHAASVTVCCEQIYISEKKLVFKSSLPALLQSFQTVPSETQQSSMSPRDQVWHRAADLPVYHPTLVSVDNGVLAIGGCTSDYRSVRQMRLYDSVNNRWQIIEHLATPRSRCLVANFYDNRIMIVGGLETQEDILNTVEYFD